MYRGDWKRRIKQVVKSMGYKLERFDDDVFVPLEPVFKQSNKSSGSNYKLAVVEIQRVIELYNNIPDSEKWKLST
ncbi:uncharacterized protein RHIMIDRAFT_295506, partial [Rhizopus microsporus ATCC 52813]